MPRAGVIVSEFRVGSGLGSAWCGYQRPGMTGMFVLMVAPPSATMSAPVT